MKDRNKDYIDRYWFHEENPMFDDTEDNPDLEFLHEIPAEEIFTTASRLIFRK